MRTQETISLLLFCGLIGDPSWADPVHSSSCIEWVRTDSMGPVYKNKCEAGLVTSRYNRQRTGTCLNQEWKRGLDTMVQVDVQVCRASLQQLNENAPCDCPSGTGVDMSTQGHKIGETTYDGRTYQLPNGGGTYTPAGPKPSVPTAAPSEFDADRKREVEQCRQNTAVAPWVSCSCAGNYFATERQKGGGPGRQDFQLERMAYDACPQDNKETLKAAVFASCQSYVGTARGDNLPSCTCVAENVATAFVAKPSMNVRYREDLRRQAMTVCSATH